MSLFAEFALLGDGVMPVFDAGYFIGLASRVLHTTCAATLLGGTIYLRFVLAPAVGDNPEATCFAGRRQAWAACVGVCTLLLLLSGFYNYYSVVISNTKMPPLYHGVFGIKFLLALVVFALSALVAGKSPLALKVRGQMTKWLTVLLVAALALFLAGAVLRSVPHIPRGPAMLQPPGIPVASGESNL